MWRNFAISIAMNFFYYELCARKFIVNSENLRKFLEEALCKMFARRISVGELPRPELIQTN